MIPDYLDAKEVVELLHVCHLEFFGEEGLDLIDFNGMLTPNDKMIHIYVDDNRTCMSMELSDLDMRQAQSRATPSSSLLGGQRSLRSRLHAFVHNLSLRVTLCSG